MSSALLFGLFAIAVLLFFGLGLLLIILGIVQKKAIQWIPGIIIAIGAAVFCITGIVRMAQSFQKTIEYNRTWNGETWETPDYDIPNDTSQNDTTSIKSSNENTSGESYITGFIRDSDKSLIHIKVMPDPVLQDMGITLTKIDTYSVNSGKLKSIPLLIDFSREFKGELQLLLYTSDNVLIGKSLVQINQHKNTAFTVKFQYPDETNFLQTSYARLKSSD
mgnify:CR=1 FL=1